MWNTGYSGRIMDTLKLQLISAMVSKMHHRVFVFEFSLDPREYSISTKEFVLDDDGKLKGLNTGVFYMASDCRQTDRDRVSSR